MPSVSKKQQKFMGIVRAIQKGKADPSDFNKDAQDAAKKMKKSSVKKYAKTKHKGLPNKKVNEGRVLHFTQIKDKTLEKHLKVIAKKVGATVSKISGGFKVDADNDGRKLAQVVDYRFDKSLMKGLMSGGGMSRVQLVNESINEEKYVVYVDKDGKGVRGRKIVKSDLTYNSAKRLSNKLAKTDDYQEVGFDDHKSWNQNN